MKTKEKVDQPRGGEPVRLQARLEPVVRLVARLTRETRQGKATAAKRMRQRRRR